jgi:hypothetical protein
MTVGKHSTEEVTSVVKKIKKTLENDIERTLRVTAQRK